MKFSIKGPGVIVATDAGDPTSHAPFFNPEIQAFHGLASVIVRRTGPGDLKLSVSSPGLESQSLILPE